MTANTTRKAKGRSVSDRPKQSPSSTTEPTSDLSATPTLSGPKNEASSASSQSDPSGSSSVQLSQIVIQNFQSIEGAVLDLAPLTVIVGEGESGKSAILRALRAALFNESGDDDISHGADQATVGLSFADGHVLIWEKPRGKGSVYTLDGQSFTKMGGQVPAEIVAATGFREIEIDAGTRISPQIHDQFDQPFIMFESGSKIARILGSLTKLNAVVQAQLICKKNGNTWSSTVVQNETELAHLTEQREAMPDVDYLSTVMDTTAADLEIVDEAFRSLERARTLTVEQQRLREQPTYDLSLLHVDLEEACVLIDKAARARGTVKQLQNARTAALARNSLIEVARRELEAVTETYTAACTGEGVCENCPFVA